MLYRILKYADGKFKVQRKRFIFWRYARCDSDKSYVVWAEHDYGPGISRFTTLKKAEEVIDMDVVDRAEIWLKKQIVNIIPQ